MKNYIHFKGFTLAETIITLGIIGVVAAMTIPNLMSKWREKALIAKLKESYSMVYQAQKLAIEEFGDVSGWSTGSEELPHEIVANKFKQFLKLSYDCVGNRVDIFKKCVPNNTSYYNPTTFAIVRLINGTTLVFQVISPTCSHNYMVNGVSDRNVCGFIYVLLEPDKKGENGLNIFNFYITSNELIPFGKMNSSITFEKACDPNNKHPYPGFNGYGVNMYGCTACVLENNNMDYWHCFDKLGWNKARNCHK